MDLALALALGLIAAAATTPAGVSGAVFLLPLQISVLGVPLAVAAPTNLLFNIIATPAGLWRMRSAGRPLLRPAAPMLAGALPGMAAGVALRASGLIGDATARGVVVGVVALVGAWLLAGAAGAGEGLRREPGPGLTAPLAFVAGVVGGIYGIGGGAILAPALVVAGASVAAIAAPALATTLATSSLGFAAYLGFATAGRGAFPDWRVGIALGVGGLVGAYLGARLAPRVPERALRVLLGLAALALAARLLVG